MKIAKTLCASALVVLAVAWTSSAKAQTLQEETVEEKALQRVDEQISVARELHRQRDIAFQLEVNAAEEESLVLILRTLVERRNEYLAERDEILAKKREVGRHAVANGFLVSGVDSSIKRLADAQIDHRIRLLEAQALTTVLEKEIIRARKGAQARSKTETMIAEAMLSQRMKEFQRMKELQAKNPGVIASSELQRAESAVHVAELQVRAASSPDRDAVVSNLNIRIADAAIELEVEKIVEERLREEMKRLIEQDAAAQEARTLDLKMSRADDLVSKLEARIDEMSEKLVLLKSSAANLRRQLNAKKPKLRTKETDKKDPEQEE